MQSIHAWHIPLVGHDFDLEDLPLWLAGATITVRKQDSGFILVVPASSEAPTYESVTPLVTEYIQILNGIGRLLNPSFRPVELGEAFVGVQADGKIVQRVVPVHGVEERAKAGAIQAVIGGVPQPDPRAGAASPFLQAAAVSDRARGVLSILSKPAPTWTDLYLILEMVEADVGNTIYKEGWITKDAANRFTGTANSFALLGLQGRHGRDKAAPPSNPISHAEATELMCSLADAWLRYTAAKADGELSAG